MNDRQPTTGTRKSTRHIQAQERAQDTYGKKQRSSKGRSTLASGKSEVFKAGNPRRRRPPAKATELCVCDIHGYPAVVYITIINKAAREARLLAGTRAREARPKQRGRENDKETSKAGPKSRNFPENAAAFRLRARRFAPGPIAGLVTNAPAHISCRLARGSGAWGSVAHSAQGPGRQAPQSAAVAALLCSMHAAAGSGLLLPQHIACT
jgi:hypothetical protein